MSFSSHSGWRHSFSFVSVDPSESSEEIVMTDIAGSGMHDELSSRAVNSTVVLEMMREMRAQRRDLQEAHALAARERRSERRWKMAFQGLVFGTPMLIGVIYFLFFLSSTGFRWGPWGDVVGVVRVEGQIAANETASAEKINPPLVKAFENPNVKAVVLLIDSPGGAPVESERIYNALDGLRRRHKKPVVAVINNLGASAAYMIAAHADRIVAGRYSLVGSIGAIMAPWQLDKAIARFDVARRIYASGRLKAFLDPFTPVTPEVDAKAHQLVDTMGQTFLADVKRARGSRLRSGVDYATGEVWAGAEAKEIGLVDAIGTLDEVVATTWILKPYDFGPAHEHGGFLSSSASDALGDLLSKLLTQQPLRWQ
jgi:protease-4